MLEQLVSGELNVMQNIRYKSEQAGRLQLLKQFVTRKSKQVTSAKSNKYIWGLEQ